MKLVVACALVAGLGCEGGRSGGATTGSASSGTGSAKGSASAAAAGPRCDLDGPYRLRFVSNGTDGWWLRFTIAIVKGTATLPEAVDMLGLPAGATSVDFDPAACTITFAAKTKQAGELGIALKVDPFTNAVTGTLVRTDKYAVEGKTGTTPITGVHDAPRKRAPACIHEGLFDIHSSAKTKWRLSQGSPRFGLGCKDSEPITHARVRIEQLGDTLFIDEDSESEGQTFGRAKLGRTGDCTATVTLELQDFKFVDAKLTFDGDKITGIAPTSRWQFMEDGEAGENLWACSGKNVALEGKRIAD